MNDLEKYRKILGASSQNLSDDALIRIVSTLKMLAEWNYEIIVQIETLITQKYENQKM